MDVIFETLIEVTATKYNGTNRCQQNKISIEIAKTEWVLPRFAEEVRQVWPSCRQALSDEKKMNFAIIFALCCLWYAHQGDEERQKVSG